METIHCRLNPAKTNETIIEVNNKTYQTRNSNGENHAKICELGSNVAST
jgi:hypothetical protein